MVKKEVKKCINPRKRKECNLVLPVLVIGGKDAMEAAQHAWDTSIGAANNLVPAGFWYKFINRNKVKPGKSFADSKDRRWYKNYIECSGTKRLMYEKQKGTTPDCDEYPFFVTTRGSYKNYPVFVSLRLINSSHNRRSGSHLKNLLNWSNIRKKGGQGFLVAPIPDANVPTAALPLKKY